MVVVDRPLEDIKMMTESQGFLSCPEELHERPSIPSRTELNRSVTVIWEDQVQGIGPSSKIPDIDPRYVETQTRKIHSPYQQKSCYFPFDLSRYLRSVELGCETNPTEEMSSKTATGDPPPATKVSAHSTLKPASTTGPTAP